MRPTSDDEAGSVTAEFAVLLPAVALLLALGFALVPAGIAPVRLADAAADAARLVGRGDPAGAAAARVARAAPGATISVRHEGDLVCVTATATVTAAGIAIPVDGMGCALDDSHLSRAPRRAWAGR